MIKIKNISGEIKTLHGKEFAINEEHIIDDGARADWYTDSKVLLSITSELFQIGNGEEFFESISDQISFLNGSKITVSSVDDIKGGKITSEGMINDHTLEPWGAALGKFKPSDYSCAIDLSDKSQDGLTFTYSCTKIPVVGAYVFQNDAQVRSWITEVDTVNSKITFDLPVMENGINNCYRQGVYIDCLVRDWKKYMYLWGLYVKILNCHDDDFVELDIVDKSGKFDDDSYCMEQFGVDSATAQYILPSLGFEKLGEFPFWTKYYDESWVINMNHREVRTPDGAPGKLLNDLWIRFVYFPRYQDASVTVGVYLDYLATSKDSENA